MHSTARHFSIALALTAGAAGLCTQPAQAQTTVDVSKITCEQFLSFKVGDPRDISVWLSGYFHGRQADTTFLPQQFSDNYNKLKSACFSATNVKRSIFELAEEMARAK
jgi:hypothetical protein